MRVVGRCRRGLLEGLLEFLRPSVEDDRLPGNIYGYGQLWAATCVGPQKEGVSGKSQIINRSFAHKSIMLVYRALSLQLNAPAYNTSDIDTGLTLMHE